VLYIVLSYLTPYRVHDVPPKTGQALDSYLADLWDELGGLAPANPYFGAVNNRQLVFPPLLSFAEYREQPNVKTFYSVWRLDGRSRDAASALVDKAMRAEQSGARGLACFDRRFGDIKDQPETGYYLGDWELLRAAQLAREAGLRVLEDAQAEEFGTPPAPLRCENAFLYSGWYHLHHYNDAFTWAPGAIGFHLDSESINSPREGESWSAGALARGITVTAGAVDEPYLEGLPRPATIFYMLLRGANVGDAFLRGEPWLRWQIVKVGDPLYRPFPPAKP